jgi:membrane-bound serine protease (ClpP class)
MTRLTKILALVAVFSAAVVFMNPISANNTPARIAMQLTIDDAIGPAADDYIERSLETAANRNAELVVIRMDTPGGLDTAMRAIIKNIINSSVPVITYVAPSGARAASAGTYILYASHVAAMAPGTNVGAATPVSIGGIAPPEGDEKEREKKAAADSDNAMKKKVINDAVAYLQSLAQLRGRNQAWAEQAVRNAASLSANEALKMDVIDIVAANMDELMQQLDGREVVVQGQSRTLHSKDSIITLIEPDWRNRLLSVITNPNVAYILMLIGIYGLILEFTNPGAILPGTVGAISLLLALYAFQLLPINYAGMALILLGIALMIGEAFQPSFGVLGIGGGSAFIIGSIILMDTEAPGFGIDISVILAFGIISALVFIAAIGMAFKARKRQVVTGQEELLSGVATVMNDFEHQGQVFIHGESWNAQSHTPLRKGQQVKVTEINGLTLEVAPIEATQPASTEEKRS